MKIKGTIEAPSDRSVWDGKNNRHWIIFEGINNLYVGGGGTINGNGEIWWENSCKINKSLVRYLFSVSSENKMILCM